MRNTAYENISMKGRAYLESEYLLNVGVIQVLKRDTAEILETDMDGVMVRDRASGAVMLSCEDMTKGKRWLRNHEDTCDYKMMEICQKELAEYAKERYQFGPLVECKQAVYMKQELPQYEKRLEIRKAEKEDLAFMLEHYDKLSADELCQVICNRELYIGEHEGEKVGFIGIHLEGGMGILRVLPKYRRKGYGMELECFLIHDLRKKELEAFAQIQIEHQRTMELQQKIGMAISKESIYWLFQE